MRLARKEDVTGQYHGPLTLEQMGREYRDYERTIAIEKHNRSGRNPTFPGDFGTRVADVNAAKIKRIEENFPAFKDARR